MALSPHAYRMPYRTEAREWIRRRWPLRSRITRLPSHRG
jgi:hypothetical protein